MKVCLVKKIETGKGTAMYTYEGMSQGLLHPATSCLVIGLMLDADFFAFISWIGSKYHMLLCQSSRECGM
jgi:hypothetical protein